MSLNTLNNVDEKFTVLIRLYKIKLADNVPQLSDTTDDSQGGTPSTLLIYDQVEEMRIYHSLTNPVINGYVIYTDLTGDLGKFMADTSAYMSVDIIKQQRPDSNSSKPNAVPVDDLTNQFTHTFLVDSIEVLEYIKDTTKVKISFKSEYAFNFMENVICSTEGKPQTLSQILNVLCADTGIRLVPSEKSTDEDTKLIFLTIGNSTLLESIYQVLDRGFSIKDGPSFLVYDNNTDEFFIFTWNTPNPRPRTQSDNRYTVLIKNKDVNISLSMIETHKVESKDFITSSQVYDRIKSITKHRFNYRQNKWEEPVEITSKSIVKSLYPETISETNALFEPQVKMYPNSMKLTGDRKFNIHSQFNMVTDELSRDVRDICVNNNVILPTVQGVLTRTPGDIITVITGATKENRTAVNQFVGRWILIQVEHVFRQNSYTNRLMLGRNVRIADLDRIASPSTQD